MNNVQTLKGFRDFLPSQKRVRTAVATAIANSFERFGFEPLETPTLEYASLLLGKYGSEADKLVYTFEDRGNREVALRYDQTVPTARVLAQYQNELPKFFRRYQIQNVFRADKPQKGRYREFTQCDIDIYNTTSPLADAEILAGTYEALSAVGFSQIEIKINDRQTLLTVLSPFATDQVPVYSIVQTIDKLDKMTPADVAAELVAKGLSESRAENVLSAIAAATMSEQLQEISKLTQQLGIPESTLIFTPSLARGLDYYTGMIFEITIPGYEGGSCGGGGRYDNLIGQLCGKETPAVGVGIGFDRVVEAALALGIATSKASTKALVTVFETASQSLATNYTLQITTKLRKAGIAVELYPTPDDLSKQFKYADKKGIPFVIVAGEAEQSQNIVVLKNLVTGQQDSVSIDKAISTLATK